MFQQFQSRFLKLGRFQKNFSANANCVEGFGQTAALCSDVVLHSFLPMLPLTTPLERVGLAPLSIPNHSQNKNFQKKIIW